MHGQKNIKFLGLLYKQLVHFHTFFEQTALNEQTVGGFCPFTCTCNVKIYKHFRSTSQRKRVLKNILRKLHYLSVHKV